MVGLQLTKYGGENSKVNKLFICTQLNPQLISGIFREQDKEWQQQQGIIFKGKKPLRNGLLFTGLSAVVNSHS